MRDESEGSWPIGDFEEGCTDCGACRDACPFLEQYGSPGEIIRERPHEVFLCANCGACDAFCPAELSPSKALYSTKSHLIAKGSMPDAVGKALAGARGFVRFGHHFLFRHFPYSPTVFWPGCALAGTSPGLVRKVQDLLGKSLGEPVGLALDCCGDPLHQLGDTGGVRQTVEGIAGALSKGAIKQIITGCVNCQKVLGPSLDGVRVSHVLSLMPGVSEVLSRSGDIYLHHPCHAGADAINEKAVALTAKFGRSVVESLGPMCCGHGGGLVGVDSALADRFLTKIVESAGDRSVVTYCMGCGGRLAGKGVEARHLLAMVVGVSEPLGNPGPSRRWAVRGLLSLTERIRNPKFLVALLVVAVIAALLYLRWAGYFSLEEIFSFLKNHPVLAPAVFLGVYCVAPALLLPAIPLSLAAGFLWGPVWGVVLTIVGATMGASLSFLIARYVLGDAVRRRLGEEKWEAFTKIVEKHGWKAVAVSRLVPILPFNLLNYFFGITPVPFRHYLWCSFVFMLPGCVAFVAFGHSIGDTVRGDVKGLLVGLAVAAAAFTLPLAFKPMLRKIMGDRFGGRKR